MTMINDPVPFVKLVQKILVGNHEPIMGICEKTFIINLHNLEMLFMLWIENKFSECVAPCTNMKVPSGRLSGDGSAEGRRHGGAFGGSYPQIFFVHPQILLCSEKFVLNIR